MTMKIGDFARLGQVSVRMLRHYDKLKLLSPAEIDPETGFRYYIKDQLVDLHRIRDLQALGFSLKDILALRDDESVDDLHRQLWEMQAKLQREVTERQRQIRELQYRMAYIEHQATAKPVKFSVKHVPAETIVHMRGFVDYDDLIEERFHKIETFVDQHEIAVRKALGIKHYSANEYEWALSLANATVQCLRINSQIELSQRQLPAVMVASAVFQGSYLQADPSFNGFREWAHHHGYALCGSVREIYFRLVNRDIHHPDNLMEVQFPIQQIG